MTMAMIFLGKTHLKVMQSIAIMLEFVERGLVELPKENHERVDKWIMRQHDQGFIHWMKNQTPSSDNKVKEKRN